MAHPDLAAEQAYLDHAILPTSPNNLFPSTTLTPLQTNLSNPPPHTHPPPREPTESPPQPPQTL